MDEIQDYNYSPLLKRSIRVLELTECNADEEIVRGSLRQISLDGRSELPFDSLSYACGPPVYDKRILVDGKKVLVTENCRNALRHLRHQFGVRTVWVDAVSIDGGNAAERSDQLRLMTEVYGKARRVYIWLGEPSHGSDGGGASDRALDLLQEIAVDKFPLLGVRLGKFPKNMHWREIVKAIRLIPDVFRAKIRRVGLVRSLIQYDHEAVRNIIARPWFTRMWTVQEAAMAGEAFAVCGTKKIRWNQLFWGIVEARTMVKDDSQKDELSAVIDAIYGMYSFWLEIGTATEYRYSKHRSWLSRNSAQYNKWIAFLDFMENRGWGIIRAQLAGIAAIVTIRLFQGLRPLNYIPVATLCCTCALTALLKPPKTNVQCDHNLRNVFVNLLNKSRQQQSTEPKDKVYALYGLLQQLDIRLPQPNTSREHSLENTYLDFTHSIIQWHRSLDVLQEASGPWSHGAPSWVPDWRKSYRRLQFSDDAAIAGRSLQTLGPPYTFSENHRQLVVSSKPVGTVVCCADPIEEVPATLDLNDSNIPFLPRLCKNVITLRKWLKAVRDVHHLSVDDISAFLASFSAWQDVHTAADFHEWADLILNDHLPIPSNDILEFANTPVSAEHGRRLVDEICRRDLLSPGPEWRVLLTLATYSKLWRLHQKIRSTLAGTMTLFVAVVGKSYLLGVGATCVQRNDTIALFITPKPPVIVRALEGSEGKFQFMGAAHIPGPRGPRTWPEVVAEVEVITLV